MSYKGNNSLRRQEAVGMEELVNQFIRDMKLASGLKRQRAEEAWNKVTGAGRYTLELRLYKGVMTCILSSSAVRNQLFMQKERILWHINEILSKDELFECDGKTEKIDMLILK